MKDGKDLKKNFFFHKGHCPWKKRIAYAILYYWSVLNEKIAIKLSLNENKHPRQNKISYSHYCIA